MSLPQVPISYCFSSYLMFVWFWFGFFVLLLVVFIYLGQLFLHWLAVAFQLSSREHSKPLPTGNDQDWYIGELLVWMHVFNHLATIPHAKTQGNGLACHQHTTLTGVFLHSKFRERWWKRANFWRMSQTVSKEIQFQAFHVILQWGKDVISETLCNPFIVSIVRVAVLECYYFLEHVFKSGAINSKWQSWKSITICIQRLCGTSIVRGRPSSEAREIESNSQLCSPSPSSRENWGTKPLFSWYY